MVGMPPPTTDEADWSGALETLEAGPVADDVDGVASALTAVIVICSNLRFCVPTDKEGQESLVRAVHRTTAQTPSRTRR